MSLIRFVILGFIAFGLVRCSSSSKSESSESSKIIAKVNDNVLYSKDMQDIVPLNSSSKDSAEIIDRYITNWIRKQLLFSQAKEQLSLDNPEIERKVEDYRYSLYIFELKKRLLLTRLDSNVSEKDISEYYQKDVADFLLQNTIVKGLLIKAPLNSIAEKSLKNQLSIDSLPLKEIIQVCADNQYVLKYSLEQWQDIDNILSGTPFIKNAIELNWKKGNSYLTAKDKDFIYLLKIIDLKKPIEPAPIEYVKENIKAIIINKRKLAIANELEDQLFDDAVKKNKVEINYKPFSAK